MKRSKIYRVCGTPSRGGCITFKYVMETLDQMTPICIDCMLGEGMSNVTKRDPKNGNKNSLRSLCVLESQPVFLLTLDKKVLALLFGNDLQVAVPLDPSKPFGSIEDAHWSLSSIGAGMICNVGESQRPPTETLKERHIGLLSIWEAKLQVYLSQADENDPAIRATLRGVALLKIFHVLSSTTNDRQERSEALFSDMVDLCGTVDPSRILDGENLTPRTIFNFTSDSGTIAPLFFVALRCQSPVTRLRAWKLMKREPRKEGLWDSERCADIVEKTMGGFEGPDVENGTDVMGR